VPKSRFNEEQIIAILEKQWGQRRCFRRVLWLH
jgi:hypothetical protein